MASAALPHGYKLGEYLVESVLGQGGFGITYLAKDTKLGARVAIKEYFPRGLATRNDQYSIVAKPGNAAKDYQWGLEQFLKEAQALARFKHNHIVRVLRFLEVNGTAYMVMEYEEGEGLSDYMKKQGGRLDEPMLLQIFVPILNGLQAVHSAGLLHLDIKPDNVYLRSDGQPMLIDFGSARQTARGPGAQERIALTPAYAAIEQYPDKGKQGPWTDIYSIGASMYHCMSGKQPIDALRRYQTVLKYKTDPLTPATKLEVDGYSTYLRECIDWAIQIYPSHRPKGAIQLQEGLMGKGRPGKQQAQPVIKPEQNRNQESIVEEEGFQDKVKRVDFWKIAQGALVSLIIVVSVVVAIAYWKYRSSPHVAAIATNSDTEYTAVENEAYTRAAIEKAKAADRVKLAKLTTPTIFHRKDNVELARTLAGHRGSVYSLAFLANGRQLASASEDGTIRIWDINTGTTVQTLTGHKRSVFAIAVSPNGQLLVSAGNERDLFMWDVRSGKQTGKLSGHDYDVYTLQFSTDGRLLASSGKDQSIILWDMNKKRALRTLEGHEGTVLTLSFSPDGKGLLSGGEDGQLKHWDTESGKQTWSMHGHRGLVSAVGFSPDGKWFVSSGKNNMLKLWNAETGELQHTMTNAPRKINALMFTPDSKQLVAGGSDKILRIWSVSTGEIVHELSGHRSNIQAVVLSPDRKTIASAGSDGLIQIWQNKKTTKD
jgi:WD40 repeat protein